MSVRPGRRVLVTRAVSQSGKLSEGLRAIGAEAVEVPVLEIRAPESYERLDAAIHDLDLYDWLILTSANAVRAIAERARDLGNSLHEFALPKIAVVGTSTGAEAKKIGLGIDLTPKEYVAESLVSKLKDQVAGKRILIARAAITRDVIPDALRTAGATVDVVEAYRNVMPEAAPERLRRAIAAGLDASTFTSSSSVTHLAEAAKAAGIDFPFADVPAISIGPITSATLRGHGWEPTAEADPHDIPGLVEAVRRVLAGA